MLVLHAADLERQGIAIEAVSQMVFCNLIFTKEETFSPDRRQVAIAACQKYLKADILCVIVERQGNLTLWRENKDINLPAKQAAIAPEEETLYENPFEPSSAGSKSQSFQKMKLLKSGSGTQPPTSGFAAKNEKSTVR